MRLEAGGGGGSSRLLPTAKLRTTQCRQQFTPKGDRIGRYRYESNFFSMSIISFKTECKILGYQCDTTDQVVKEAFLHRKISCIDTTIDISLYCVVPSLSFSMPP